jgi:hypothetical protein
MGIEAGFSPRSPELFGLARLSEVLLLEQVTEEEWLATPGIVGEVIPPSSQTIPAGVRSDPPPSNIESASQHAPAPATTQPTFKETASPLSSPSTFLIF